MTNTRTQSNLRHLKSRNQREGYFWHGLNEQNKFKVRMSSIEGKRASLREYGKWLKNQDNKTAMSDKPVYQYQHEETGQIGFVDSWQVENGFFENNPRLQKVGICYPASAYEALQKENVELKSGVKVTELISSAHEKKVSQLKAENERLDFKFKHYWSCIRKVLQRHRERDAAQAKRIAELEAATEHLGLTPQQAADGLVRHKAQVAEIESLRKQVEILLGSARKTVLALAHASIHDPIYTAAYDELSESIKLASKNGE